MKDFLNQRPAFFQPHQSVRRRREGHDVYGLHVAHDGKKEKKPLRAEWLVHELTDAGKEVWEKDAADKEALS